MTPLDDSPPVSTEMTPPVCVLHRQLSRQRKAKYDGQIVLAFSPASTLALQVGPAPAPARPPPAAPIPRAPPARPLAPFEPLCAGPASPQLSRH